MDIPQIINRIESDKGQMGQEYLAAGKQVAMRRWEESAGHQCDSPARQYETVGYLVSGELEFGIGGQSAVLRPGDSWLVPAGTDHRYRVVKAIVAIEATSPPARFSALDEDKENPGKSK